MRTRETGRYAFICYATPDKEDADRIVGQLAEAGVTCWVAPRDVPLGSNYAESIVDAIERAELLVLLLSAHANASPHVANEIERAVHYRKPVVPVRLADVRPSRSLELHVSTRQWVEMWGTAETRQAGIKRLIVTLKEAFGFGVVAEVQAQSAGPGASEHVDAHQAQESSPSPAVYSGESPADGPIEADHTELEVVGHDGTSLLLLNPSIAYPGGYGPSSKKDGIAVRRGIEKSTLSWSRLRTLKFRSRQEKNDKGTTVWRHAVEATFANGNITNVELLDDWNMAYMGGGGTGLLFGQSDLGETSIPFSEIAVLKVLKYATPEKK